MKILHTSDWHLGQSLNQFDRSFEHAQFLGWLLNTLESEKVNVVKDYPETVETTVRLLKTMVPDGEQEKIRAMAEGDLIMLHFGLGQWLRNHLGLWGDNPALVAESRKQTADDASDAIIRAFWLDLREELPKIH